MFLFSLANNQIHEIEPVRAQLNFNEIDQETYDDADINENNEFIHSPVIVWTNEDHDVKINLIYVAVAMISGASDINFNVSEDGLEVILNYKWPKAMFDAEDLFYDQLYNEVIEDRISKNHPRVHALKSQLLKMGFTKNFAPKGKIVVKLPQKVQREVGSWAKTAVKKFDGSRIVLLEFKAFQEQLVIKDADKFINFD